MLKVSCRSVVAVVVALAGLQALPAAAQTQLFIGQIMCGGFNYAPQGWAEMNGQLLPISQYDALFSLIGTTYGGDGVNTFALPDVRGRTMIEQSGRHFIGETGGSETATLATVNMPPHTHSIAPLGSNNDASSVSPAGKVAASKARTTLYADPVNLVAQASGTTGSTGGGQPFDRMEPYVTVKCFMATEGIYPSRY